MGFTVPWANEPVIDEARSARRSAAEEAERRVVEVLLCGQVVRAEALPERRVGGGDRGAGVGDDLDADRGSARSSSSARSAVTKRRLAALGFRSR